MIDKELLLELLEAEYEDDAIALLSRRGLFEEGNSNRWVALGNMPNNQSVVHAQQSTPAAALVEKFTNGLDAILLRRCKARGIDPRSVAAPHNMSKAVEKWFGRSREAAGDSFTAEAGHYTVDFRLHFRYSLKESRSVKDAFGRGYS